MGGVFSAVASVFKGVGKAVSGRKKKKQIAKPVETIYKEAESAGSVARRKAAAALGAGYGAGQQTIMTGVGGIEDAAKTGKTLLGGG
tara:strand:+ start:901 stop:1161 length:261 start_codon:yes stop_codon:yes gene_type:complete